MVTIYNMFPEDDLERLLRLVKRLTTRISQIDDLGLLDASVLGEVVHPRTFNTIRRIREEDGTVLDEEEQRAELAGPELLLKQLKELLGREGAEKLFDLPDGIHSGLRRDKRHGMFFYFRAPRPGGEGHRHFWRYIDARTHEILDNRFEIAQIIGCQRDEPRYIGDQDVFALQEEVIKSILHAERVAEAKAAAPSAVDAVQQTVTEELKGAIRRGAVNRDQAKAAIHYLRQPAGRFAIGRLKKAYARWSDERDDEALLQAVSDLAADFGKEPDTGDESAGTFKREELELVCFEYVSS